MSVYQTEQEFYTEGGTERLPSVMKRGCEVAFAKIKHFLKTTDTYLAPRVFKGWGTPGKVDFNKTWETNFQMTAGLPTSFEYSKI